MIKFIIKIIDNYYHKLRIFDFFSKKNIHNYIDVGAFEGSYTDIFLKKAKKCIIFEPQRKYYLYLNSKYKNNKKVKVFNFALGEKFTKKKLKINYLESTSTLSTINKNSKWYKFKKLLLLNKDYTKEYLVKVKPLDGIDQIKKLKEITVLKIDAEGYDLNVLKGAKKKLTKIRYIIVERHIDSMYKNYNFKEISNFMKLNKFRSAKKIKFPFLSFYDEIFTNSRFKE